MSSTISKIMAVLSIMSYIITVASIIANTICENTVPEIVEFVSFVVLAITAVVQIVLLSIYNTNENKKILEYFDEQS